MVTPRINYDPVKATKAVSAWIKRQQRRGCIVELVVAGLAFAAGLGAVTLTFCVVWAVCLVFAPMVMIHAAPWWPLLITAVVEAMMLVDSIYSRRDDLSIVSLWMLRETIGVGPRLLVECARGIRRADRLAAINIRSCAEVLAFLAQRRKSVSRDELLKAFPGLSWARLQKQLAVFPGVLFLRADLSRVTLTEPLRQAVRHVLGPNVHYQPEPEPEPEPEPKRRAEPKRGPEPTAAPEPQPVEPESLTPHEILGVSPAATWAEVKAAYRNRMKECHPDRFPQLDAASREMAEEWTKSINAAYTTLAASMGRTK